MSEKVIIDPNNNATQSEYLNFGRKEDVWEIVCVEIEGDCLKAQVRMKSYYISETDNRGFHLSIFSTLEFLSQLKLIYSHHWAKLESKTLEGWLVESNVKSKKAIRSSEEIFVEMDVLKMLKRHSTYFMISETRVYDADGGEFTARLKAFLS